MKKRAVHDEHVHINFKVAIIAIFFFFVLFELHAPIFKTEATGYVPRSLGHWDKEDARCECPQGSQRIKSYCDEDATCTCYDDLYQQIVPGRCI